MIIIEQILITSEAAKQAAERVQKLKFAADYWPTEDDVRRIIIPNIQDMYMYICWTLETCHSPSSLQELESQKMLQDVIKKYFALDDGAELDTGKTSEIITMTYDKYERLCEEADQDENRATEWPSIKEMNKWIKEGMEPAVEKFIWYLETAPTPVTEKEMNAQKYMNMVIRSRVMFVDTEG